MRKLEMTMPWREFDFAKLKTENSVCLVRYGAFGDMMQASSVFPALKEQGFHLTVNVSKYGYDVIRNDPHVDCVLIQPSDLVPNEELGDYWSTLSKSFTKFINLSESVERSLLATEPDKCCRWHKDFRDMVMGVDYLAATHAIAECLDYPYRPKFYRSKTEEKWAKSYRLKLGSRNKIIMWALSGSGLHKVWPHMDPVIARLMLEHKEVKIVFVGDALCQMLEYPWENESRVLRQSGKWSIRDTLAFIPECDLVIGPETGVLNAAAFEPMKKIILLSHSSPVNLGGSWPNTTVITPNVPCYPCHKLHYDWTTCVKDETTGVSLCASSIPPDTVYNAIVGALYE